MDEFEAAVLHCRDCKIVDPDLAARGVYGATFTYWTLRNGMTLNFGTGTGTGTGPVPLWSDYILCLPHQQQAEARAAANA